MDTDFTDEHRLIFGKGKDNEYRDVVILELRAVRQLLPEHEAQLLNYLKATTIEASLLLNFGPKAETKRKIYNNPRKGSLAWTNK